MEVIKEMYNDDFVPFEFHKLTATIGKYCATCEHIWSRTDEVWGIVYNPHKNFEFKTDEIDVCPSCKNIHNIHSDYCWLIQVNYSDPKMRVERKGKSEEIKRIIAENNQKIELLTSEIKNKKKGVAASIIEIIFWAVIIILLVKLLV